MDQIEEFTSDQIALDHKNVIVQPPGGWELDQNVYLFKFDTFAIRMFESFGFEDVKEEINLLEFCERFVHPRDIAFIKERHQYSIERKDDPAYYDRFEFEVVMPKGQERFLLVNSYFHSPDKIQGIIQDITDLKTIRDKSRSKDASLRSVIENTDDYVFILNTNEELVVFNEHFRNAMLDIFRIQLNQGLRIADELPELMMQQWKAYFVRAFQGERFSEELSLEYNGKEYRMDISVNPIVIEGELTGVAFFIKDITTRWRFNQVDLLENRVMEQAFRHQDIDEVMYTMLSGMENLIPGMHSYITLRNGDYLEWLVAPMLALGIKETFPKIPIGPNMASCGTAAYTGKPVLVMDIRQSDSWVSFRDAALLYGYESCLAFPINNAKGEVIGTLGAMYHKANSATDFDLELLERAVRITAILMEKNLTEINLVQQNIKLSEISNSIPGIIFEVMGDVQGNRKFTYVSEKVSELLGFTPDELTSNYEIIWSHLHPEDLNPVKVSLEESIAASKLWNLEYRLKKKGSAAYNWFRVNALHKRLEDGTTVSYGTLTDITELKKNEQIINKQQEIIRKSGELANVGAYEFNILTNELIWSDQLFRIFDIAPSTPVDELYAAYMSRIHPDDSIGLNKMISDAIQNGENYSGEHRIIIGDSTVRWVFGKSEIAFDEERNPISIKGICQDITEQKYAAETILSQLREKEVLIEDIQLLAKNNLSIISSLLQLQQLYHPQLFASKLLKESQSRMKSMSLIQDQLYSGVNPSKVNFGKCILGIVEEVKKSYPDLSLAIAVETEIEEVDFNLAYAVPCGLIVHEILSNIYRHAFTGRTEGLIKVTFMKSEDEGCLLDIQDNGIGLTNEFNPEISGRLGLNLIYTLADQMAGKISISGEKGTRVTLEFPVD